MKHANLIATTTALILGAVAVWFVYIKPREKTVAPLVQQLAEAPEGPVAEGGADAGTTPAMAAGAPEHVPAPEAASAPAPENPRRPLALRVDARGFGASEQDIRKLLESGSRELWKHFPGYEVEPIVVARSDGGPITIFNRNLRGEIIVKLGTRGTAWSQYSYQWAHELCHVLCGFRPEGMQNKWFEEALCELASIYVMRRMAESWEDDPPYANWADYRHSLRSYAADVIESREKVSLEDLPEFYQKHKIEFGNSNTDRALAGAVAVTLLPWFEAEPSRWEAVRWLNADTAPDERSFSEFLREWQRAVPVRHRENLVELREMFGFTD